MKLSDYGLVPAGGFNVITELTRYMAPEVRTTGRELKSDVWSHGVALCHVSEQKDPFKSVDFDEVSGWQSIYDPPSLSSEKWSAEFVDFVGKCLVKDVNERWSVKQLMEVSSWEMV